MKNCAPPKDRPSASIRKCVKTLCDYTASILVAAADKGQYAVSDDKLGSIFTFKLTNNLKILMNKSVDESGGLPWQNCWKRLRKKRMY